MDRFLFRRICAAFLIFSLFVSLQMQETTAAATFAGSSLVSLEVGEMPNPEACDGCQNMPAMNTGCPIAVCGDFAAIGDDNGEITQQTPIQHLRLTLATGVDLLANAPDPHPPRLSIQ